MKPENIVSAVMGIKVEDIVEKGEQFKNSSELMKKWIFAIIKDSKNDGDLIACIKTAMSMMLQGLPIETRAEVLEGVAMVSLSGMSDDIMEKFKKFREDKN